MYSDWSENFRHRLGPLGFPSLGPKLQSLATLGGSKEPLIKVGELGLKSSFDNFGNFRTFKAEFWKYWLSWLHFNSPL
jgi:hypothetical protein